MQKPARIIDFHGHLGDIFHENKNITFKRTGSVPHPQGFDPFEDLEQSGFTRPLIVPDVEAQNVLIDAGQHRVWDRGNIFTTGEMMDRCGVNYFVNMPILPNTSFEEGLAASRLDGRYIPFTCPDFELPEAAMLDKHEKDIAWGAKGLKLHPIIQNVELTAPASRKAIELFGEMGMPVTWHCGVNDYYRADSPHHAKTNLNYGALDYSFQLLDLYPDFVLVPAHGGGSCGGELEALAEYVGKHGNKHVYVEMTHRGAADIKKAIELFGEDRVMYASDWPFDTCDCNIACGVEALGDNPALMDKYFYLNAARILRI